MKRIIGLKVSDIFRCVDMLCLSFGQKIASEDEDAVPEYRFHIQTQWRFVKGEHILLGSRDIYNSYVPEKMYENGWDYDVINRPDEESSIFDVVVKELSDELSNVTATNVGISPLGDLRIDFSSGSYFETFTPSMRKDEEWRFISAYDREHFIVFDT